MTFQRIDMRRPEAAKRLEPGVDFHQRLGPDAVNAALRIDPGFDEARFAQYAQMFGDSRLTDLQQIDQFSHEARLFTDQIQKSK